MHHQFRLSILQWNPGPARRNPTQVTAATCGRFHVVISQEASDHVPHVSDQFIAYTGNTDLAILLNKDTFEPNPAVYTFQEASSSKDAWGMVIVIVRGLLRRPSLSGTPTVTFCSAHIHKVVAKKRNASTDLLRRLHAHMQQHNVDFLGGDFNMSAFSTVCDVLAGSWRKRIASARGFSSCRSDHTGGRLLQVQQRGPCTWALWLHGPLSRLPSPAHHQLSVPDSITRSEQTSSTKAFGTQSHRHERRQSRRRITQPPAS